MGEAQWRSVMQTGREGATKHHHVMWETTWKISFSSLLSTIKLTKSDHHPAANVVQRQPDVGIAVLGGIFASGSFSAAIHGYCYCSPCWSWFILRHNNLGATKNRWPATGESYVPAHILVVA